MPPATPDPSHGHDPSSDRTASPAPSAAPVRVAFLASYRGSSARAIVAAARAGRLEVEPVLLVHNNEDAEAQHWARDEGLRVERLSGVTHPDPADLDVALRDLLRAERVDLVVLSGWMKRVGPATIDAFRGRILNVHPAPIPEFGGEGMWGMHVHRAVFEAGLAESAVTIHEVDELYDHGPVLHVQAVDVSTARSPEDVQRLVAEHEPEAYVGAVLAFVRRHRRTVPGPDGTSPGRSDT